MFQTGAIVKAILSVDEGKAYLQNADTNAYLEGKFNAKAEETHTHTPDSIGAAPSVHKHTKSEITDFPTSMPASDVPSWAKQSAKPTYTASEVGAAPSSHNQAASTITAGTFAGQVVANASGQAYSASVLRNSKLVSAETNPTVNGEICWTYG